MISPLRQTPPTIIQLHVSVTWVPHRCPIWEPLYADDQAVIADFLEECLSKHKAWKEGMESKGLRVNMNKTKLMITGPGLAVLRDVGAFPCAVSRSSVGVNASKCSQCTLWVHKKHSGLQGRRGAILNNVCPRCRGHARPLYDRTVTQIYVGGTLLNIEASFCYLMTCWAPVVVACLQL